MLTISRSLCLAAFTLLTATVSLQAQVPNLVHYQGRVLVGSTNFTGSGSFKFALVDTTGASTFWSNDGTSSAGSQPSNVVSLTVTNGLYSVLLGDTTLASMTVLPASVFSNADVRLRVWFSDGSHGFQLLTPDQRLAPSGYLPDGAVTSAAGVVTAGNVYQGTAATIQGTAMTLTNTLSVTIRNTGNDDFGSYAGDGLNDAWQVEYFGLNNPKAAPNVLSDGSGLTNLFKYTAGLIPNNTASTFTVTTQAVAGQPGQKNVTFSPTFPDRNYTVLSSTDLTHWSTLTGPFSGSGSSMTVLDTDAAGPQKFYRIQIDKP